MFFSTNIFFRFYLYFHFSIIVFSNCFSCMVSSRCFFQYFSKIMFPCIFFFKNCISSISFPAQFQDVFFQNLRFFQNVFSSIGFSMSIFPELYFANFFLHVITSFFQYVFFQNWCFPVRYIFFQCCILPIFSCTLVFPECFFQNCSIFFLNLLLTFFFQNVFSRIVFCQFYCAPCAHQFFQECFFPELHFAIFFPAPSAYHFFQDVFSRIAFLLFFSAPCAYQFFPECFFQNCILPIFSCTL